MRRIHFSCVMAEGIRNTISFKFSFRSKGYLHKANDQMHRHIFEFGNMLTRNTYFAIIGYYLSPSVFDAHIFKVEESFLHNRN